MEENIKIPTDFILDRWKNVVKYDFAYEGTYENLIVEALDLPPKFVELLGKEEREVLINIIFNICYPSENPINKTLNEGHLINFNDITFGRFVDLEIFFSKGLEGNIEKIVEKLYNVKPSKYTTIGEVYPAILSYLNFRTLIYTKYKNLFGLDKYEFFKDDMAEEKNLNNDPAYVWFDMLMVLADGKFLNIEEVTNKPLISALNFLAWTKEKLEIEQRNIKNELQRHSRSY